MTTPAVVYLHRAMRSLRARATMVVLRIRPPRRRTRSWNHRLSAEPSRRGVADQRDQGLWRLPRFRATPPPQFVHSCDGKSRSSITRPRDSILRMLSVGLGASRFVLQKKQAHTGLVI